MASTRTRVPRHTAAFAESSKDEKAGAVPTRGGMAGREVSNATAGFTLSVEPDRIIVRHTGALTAREIEASRREVVKLATKRSLVRILLDLSSAATGLAPVDIFELCSVQSFVLPQGATVAVVYRPGQFTADDAHFAEAVVSNRGAILKVFTDFEAAQRWLSGK